MTNDTNNTYCSSQWSVLVLYIFLYVFIRPRIYIAIWHFGCFFFFLQLPPVGRLHFDESDEDMDTDIADILTPSRTSDHRQLLSLMVDEDSGLGMDTEDMDYVKTYRCFF